MLTNLKKWFHAFEHNYKHHFEVQDKFFFPLRACPTYARLQLFPGSRAPAAVLSVSRAFACAQWPPR